MIPGENDQNDANEDARQVDDDRGPLEVLGQLSQTWRIVNARVAAFRAFQAFVLPRLVQILVVVMTQRRRGRLEMAILVKVFVAQARVVAPLAVALIRVKDEAQVGNIPALIKNRNKFKNPVRLDDWDESTDLTMVETRSHWSVS